MNILVSACLLGVRCRYDGGGELCPGLSRLMERHHLVPVCPEIFGGLSTPRCPAERQGEQVITRDGADVTAQYQKGAKETLRLARLYECPLAILKERSPSCGCGQIYDGSFSGRKVPGDGMTAALLKENGIAVAGETVFEEAVKDLENAEGGERKGSVQKAD